MKIFKLDFPFLPSHEECSIIVASNEKEALEIFNKESSCNYIQDQRVICGEVWENEGSDERCCITEFTSKKGVVYTGTYCC